ncbi:MAG: LamG-like jellyroll fold domain-containing protein [Planctomycetota bacterium]
MNNKEPSRRKGLTMMEMIISLTIIAVIFAVIVPQFRNMENSWASKQATAEMLQNGRVLTSYLNQNLAKATRIIAVSDPCDTTGYIEFKGNDSITYRCEIGADNIVEFGPVGNLVDLAGPVSQLQFTCYDVYDLDTPITTVGDIRSVNVQITLTDSGPGQDRNFTTQAYLRTNTQGLVGQWKLDETSGLIAADSSGYGNDGTLANMAGNEWTTGVAGGALEFDGDNDYIEGIGNCPTASFTVAGWAKDTGPATGSNKWSVLYSADQEIWFGVDRGASPQFWLDVGGNGHGAKTAAGAWTRNDWHHLAATWDETTVHIYIDGVDMPITIYGVPNNPQAKPGVIGDWRKSGNEVWYGPIDDVRIYNCVLTADEIAALASIPVYREFTEVKAASDTTSITISTPTNTERDDLLIAAIATDGDTSLSLAPPVGEGWTEINIEDYLGEVTLGAWWKNADASESGSHQFSWTGDEGAYAWMMRFTGHDSTDPVDIWATSGETGPAPTSPAATTTVENCLILRMGAFDDDDITVDAPGLSGHTAITMDSSGGDVDSSGLVGWWKLDEASGLTAADSSGNGNDATLTNMAGNEWTNGVKAGALEFDSPGASDDMVIVNQHASINDLETFTLTTWVYVNSHRYVEGAGVHSGYGRFFQKHPGSFIFCLGYYSDQNMVLSADGWGNRGFWRTDNGTIQAGQWYHVAVSYDYSSTANNPVFYIDGVSVNVNETETPSGSRGSDTSNLLLGTQGPPWSQHLDGILDDMRIYNRILTAVEIATLAGGDVSGGAGYVSQGSAGDSGTSTFSLTDSQEASTLTIGITPGAEIFDHILP